MEEAWIKKTTKKDKPADEEPARPEPQNVLDADNDPSYYPELDNIDLSQYKLPDDAFPDDELDDDFEDPLLMDAAPPRPAPSRRVVKAPVIRSEEAPADPATLVIKAEIAKDGRTCRFYVSRPVLEGFSAWYTSKPATQEAPLAAAIHEVLEYPESILLHDYTVTVTLPYPLPTKDWEEPAQKVGALIREFLDEDRDVVGDAFYETMPEPGEIRERLTRILEEEINPGVASHGGVITLNKVEGNSAYITMGGGCQGCSAASLTLREGIFNAFRNAVPELGAILDETDHSSGTNPYYTEPIAGIE